MINRRLKVLPLAGYFLFLSSGCRLAKSNQYEGVQVVTINELVADPTRYVGKRVGVSGYFHLAYEESVLYRSREHQVSVDCENAVWIYAAKNKELNAKLVTNTDQYVTIYGVLLAHPDGEGHLRVSKFGLDRVSRVETLVPVN